MKRVRSVCANREQEVPSGQRVALPEPVHNVEGDPWGALISLVELSSRPCLLVDSAGRIVARSKRACGNNSALSAALETSFLDLVPAVDRAQVASELATLTVGHTRTVTLLIGDRSVTGSLQGGVGPGGDGVLFLACEDDPPALETTQTEVQELRHQVEILKAAFDASFDGLYVTDGDGTMLLTNLAYERVTGWPSGSIVGMNVREMVAKGMIDRSATMEALRQSGAITTIVQVNGGNRLITTANPVRDDQGKVKYVVGNARRIIDLLPKEDHWLPFFTEGGEARRNEDLRLWKEFVAAQGSTTESGALIGNSAAFREVIAAAVRAAEFDSPVLILGESGVGKGLLAKLIHHMSQRRGGPFVEVNCGAIPETLLESELFGYEKGAFTDARSKGKKGWVEAANHGTLFLDEISELPLSLQVKLLKFLDDMSFMPVGAVTRRTVDVKIIAASNANLEQCVGAGRFRHDLYFRLAVLPITIPSLRERREDIPLLAEYFLKIFEKRYGKAKRISSEALIALMQGEYSGNVRELRNMIERVVIMTPGKTIELPDLPASLRGRIADPERIPLERGNLRSLLREYEQRIIETAVSRYRTTYDAAAALGVNQSTIVRKLQSYRR